MFFNEVIMKKILIVLLCTFSTVAFAIKKESDSVLKDSLSKLDNSYNAKNIPVLSEPLLINRSNNDISVVENLVNQDIGLTIKNNTKNPININNVTYLVNQNACATEVVNKIIKPKQSIHDYFVRKDNEYKCYKIISDTVLSQLGGGNYVLNDVAPNVDPYQFHYAVKGLFLYPIEISIDYSIGKDGGVKNIFTFLVYQRT